MKKNKHPAFCINFCINFFIFSLFVCVVPLIFLTVYFLLPPQYENTFLGEMKYKLQRLQETDEKRIVIVGGSSVPFAMKSELLETAFPEYEIVDFGMYANLGTVIMLDWAKSEVHEGDIFIIMPEQNTQTLSCYFSGKDIWQASDGAFELITLLPSKRYEKLFASFPVFAGKKLFYAINGAPLAEDIYARSSFNFYGDISYPDREYNIMTNEYNPNDFIQFSENMIEDSFLEEMNEFATELKEKGATVYYHFPPMNQKALEGSTSIVQIDRYYDFLQSRLSFPILGNPHKCIMESGWFYDTNFHLNNSGATAFTKMLIEDIKIIFQDTSLTDINVGSVPEIPDKIIAGDNSHSDCFTYYQTSDGWHINGLTDKGKTCSSLIIPVAYNDELITGIDSNLFYKNTTLQELTIQSNIGVLYDEMFKSCSSFKKLILTSNTPSDYIIGDGLLKGTDFLIYVPQESIDNYRRHYAWQKYSSYIFPIP